MRLDKNTTTIMKGYGILFIALHNLFHRAMFGFTPENENTFLVERTYRYFDSFHSIGMSVMSIIGEFFSFLGWIGMPVFLFMSGFGLVKKYYNVNSFNNKQYIFHSWKKLFVLIIPAVVFFSLYSFVQGTWKSVIPGLLLQLTMLNNLLIPMIEVQPGVYWYFAITFELYTLFIFIRRFNIKNLSIVVGIITVLQVLVVLLFGPCSDSWSWVRHNFLGWGHVFILGMIVAKFDAGKYLPDEPLYLWLFALLSILAIPFLLLNVWTWLIIVPLVAIFFFVSVSGAINKTIVLKKIGIWLGEYSAFIFVVHPIVRTIVTYIKYKFMLETPIVLVLYVVFVFLGALLYKYIYGWLLKICFIKSRVS